VPRQSPDPYVSRIDAVLSVDYMHRMRGWTASDSVKSTARTPCRLADRGLQQLVSVSQVYERSGIALVYNKQQEEKHSANCIGLPPRLYHTETGTVSLPASNKCVHVGINRVDPNMFRIISLIHNLSYALDLLYRLTNHLASFMRKL